MDKKYGISGKVFPHESYSKENRQVLNEIIDNIRSDIRCKFNGLSRNSGLLAGVRFNDNSDILCRIESNIREDDLPKDIEDLKDVVEEALIDAASSDYYYAHEKDWG